VTTEGTVSSVFKEGGKIYSPQMQILHGDEKDTKAFIGDLKKDRRVKSLEVEGNVIFYIEVRKENIPSTFYHHKLTYVKPVVVDVDGYEYWEIASWEKKILTKFIGDVEKSVDELEILKLEQTKLMDIYFSHLMPKLTINQKRSVELAFENGYYEWPKRTDFGKLAKMMRISIPTFREHLKRAEEKLMPNLIKRIG